ncbi:hypothetical protein [Burkholderia sp. F1]|uniref:hypothetical protein n=1 Tax=Burkholderia sp. F1 TaxID=3366817 RepID=UPI003D71D0C4
MAHAEIKCRDRVPEAHTQHVILLDEHMTAVGYSDSGTGKPARIDLGSRNARKLYGMICFGQEMDAPEFAISDQGIVERAARQLMHGDADE